jgi:hypothetical protein
MHFDQMDMMMGVGSARALVRPTITGDPASGVYTGSPLEITGLAYTPATATVQWESSPAGAGTWSEMPGETGDTITVSPVSDTDYRAVVTNDGLSATSATATVTVNVVTTFIDDAITADTLVTEREPNASWSYDANGATQPNTGGLNIAGLGYGTKNSANLSPTPGTIAAGKYVEFEATLHNKDGTVTMGVLVYADSANINSVQDAFLATADGTNIKIWRRVGASDSQLATVAGTFVDGDTLGLRVTKNGSNWDLSAKKNGSEVVAIANQSHAGTLGRHCCIEYTGVSGSAGTFKDALGTTNGA